MIKKLIKNISPELFKKYLIVFGFSFLGAIINVWLLRFLYHQIGEEPLFHYTYARRVVAFSSVILMLGMGVALPRYIGLVNFEKKRSRQLLAASAIPLILITILWFICNVVFPNKLTMLIWGELTEQTVKLNRIVSLYLIGLNLHGIIHSYYRGRQSVYSAGFLELFSLAIIPLFSALGATDIVELYYFFAIGTIICMMLLYVRIIYGISLTMFVRDIKKLTSYGIRRIPGDFAWAVFAIIPAYIATRNMGVQAGGVISLGITFITLSSIPASAISFIALSRSASMLKNNRAQLRKEFFSLTVGMLMYSAGLVMFLHFFMDVVIELFFDKEMLPHVGVITKITYSIIPFVIFTLYRSLIDAAYKRPFVSYYSIISVLIFGLFMISYSENTDIISIVYALNLSYFSLAILCIYKGVKILRK